jgi:hypothetical protein
MSGRQHPTLSSDASLETRLAILEERQLTMKEGIARQAIEYERRLTELNHAHDKQVKDQSTYVSNDKYEGWQGEMNAWKDDVAKKLSLLEGNRSGVGAAQSFIFQVLPMLIAIASIVALVWVSKK